VWWGWQTTAMPTDLVTLLSGAALGAVISGAIQFRLSYVQRRRELYDRRSERKRAVYEQALRTVTHLFMDYTEDFIKTGGVGSDFRRRRERALADLHLGLLLDGSDAVRERAWKLQHMVVSFVTEENLAEVDRKARETGEHRFNALEKAYYAHVRSELDALAEAMRAELHPKS